VVLNNILTPENILSIDSFGIVGSEVHDRKHNAETAQHLVEKQCQHWTESTSMDGDMIDGYA
jgi:hypothetical protein